MIDEDNLIEISIKNINVSFDTWKRLTHLKADTGATCYEDVVVLLLNNHDKIKGVKNGNA